MLTHETENLTVNVIEKFIQELKKSNFKFYPTGSRFFGGVNENSDWDFIAEYSPEIEKFLIKKEFTFNNNVYGYLGFTMAKVMTKYFYDCHNKNNCLKIDVQLCYDIKTMIKIRDILKISFNGPLPGDKKQRSKLWDMVYFLVRDKN